MNASLFFRFLLALVVGQEYINGSDYSSSDPYSSSSGSSSSGDPSSTSGSPSPQSGHQSPILEYSSDPSYGEIGGVIFRKVIFDATVVSSPFSTDQSASASPLRRSDSDSPRLYFVGDPPYCSGGASPVLSIHIPPDSQDVLIDQSLVYSSQLKLNPENPESSKDERLSNPNVSAGTRIVSGLGPRNVSREPSSDHPDYLPQADPVDDTPAATEATVNVFPDSIAFRTAVARKERQDRCRRQWGDGDH
ncbi:MAG: hypothetical protein LBF66_02615 [Holosporales bacterium]|jgi:hypothetical protein|nr:hypothetical protein [Holosporales bacterium]